MKASARFAPALALLSLATAAVAADPAPGASPDGAVVTVAKATNACFSDQVRVTGFVVPKREAQIGVDTEGSRVSEVLVKEGALVTENQELARLIPPPSASNARPNAIPLRTPAAGLVTTVQTQTGAPASPQAGPMFKIAINNELELDAEVPSIHILKLNPGATARISRDGHADVFGKVRVVSPQIDRATQLGHVRLSLAPNPSIKVGMFARANIDARRSCGVAIPRSAIEHFTVQLVKGNVIETRRVKVGLVSDSSTEILEGVEVGDIVVADAGTSLHDGDKVRTIFVDDLDRSRVR